MSAAIPEAERAVAGAVLLAETHEQAARLIASAGELEPRNFRHSGTRAVWRAAGELVQAGRLPDAVSVAAALSGTNGGRGNPHAFVASLLDGLPRISDPAVAQWATIVREQSPDPDAPGAEREPRLTAFNLNELLARRFPARRALLCRGETAVFREGHLGEVYAPRGVGKTWLLQTLALVASAGVEALGFRAPEPCRTLYIDGEMSSEELQGRFRLLCEMLGAAPTDRLSVLGADWQEVYLPRLDTAEGQAALEWHVEGADLLLLDNRSCLFDPEAEKDPVAWQPALNWLLSLRRRGKGVLTAHHSNRMGGARGHSRPEDAMNLLLKLSRPANYVQDQGARFLLEFDKARGVHGPAAAPFVAAMTEKGWTIESPERPDADNASRKLREYLRVADDVRERPKSASAAVRGAGINKAIGLRVFAEMLKVGEVKEHLEGGYCLA